MVFFHKYRAKIFAILSLIVKQKETQMIIEQFLNQLKKISPIPQEELEKLQKICTIKEIKKGSYFLREGEKSSEIAFVVKGLFRFTYLSLKGHEFTKSFLSENNFLVAYSAILQQQESHISIEALEDSSIIVIDYYEWKELFQEELNWYKMLITILEQAFISKEKREREFLLYDAKMRYESFLQTYPHLVGRIKQNILASYLGITPVALSNLKKDLKN